MTKTQGPTAKAIEVVNLNAWYDTAQVLRNVTFDVTGGEVLSILGRNGAGKTTTLRSIMGMMDRRDGRVSIFGKDTISAASRTIARLGVGYVPEHRGIFGSLSVEENLFLPPVIKPGGFTVAQIYELFPNLRERASSRGKQLSGGEQQMLSIARILRTGADILLLDEPSEGLAPVIVQQIGQALRALKDKNYTVVLVEQNFRFASRIADRHIVIENGTVVDCILNSDLSSNISKIESYLGI